MGIESPSITYGNPNPGLLDLLNCNALHRPINANSHDFWVISFVNTEGTPFIGGSLESHVVLREEEGKVTAKGQSGSRVQGLILSSRYRLRGG
jgi:hypothetical protein